jgi:hypothetical protein
MIRHTLLLSLALASSVAFGGRASAQDVSSQPAPAFVSVIEGAATLIRDGRAEAASSNLPLLEGDRLKTETGRLEVFMPDGSLLHLDQNTTVDLLSGSLVRLTSGRTIFIVSGRSDERPSLDYQVDAAAGSVRILRPGEYRLSLVQGRPGPDLELAVVRGEATLTTNRGSVSVGAGQYSTAMDGYAPVSPESFNSARLDAFTRWSADQVDAHLGYSSQQYLPSEVQVYASTFDRYGTWDDVQPYGNVWYPTVQVGWRPYYDGYWRTVGPYGWTWIGYDPWCWPTHHYGRWGIGARGWFWIPGRSWGSAWVSWGFGAGYVGWCPLGWNNHAVIDLTFGTRFANGWGHDPWSAWTAVPRHDFGGPGRVSTIALRGDALRAAERSGFAVQRAAPPVVGRATARPFAASTSVAARRAVPRGDVGVAASGRAVAVPRPTPGASGNASAPAFDRRSTAQPRTAQPVNGMPARDSRPIASDRAPGTSPARAPAAVDRREEAPVRTYDRTQGLASDRQARTPDSAVRAERRAPASLAEVAAETNASRRSPDPAQRDAGTRVYTSAPPDYRQSYPQAIERSGVRAIQPSSAQSWSPGSRSIPPASSYERRAPESVAAPRSFDRSSTTNTRPIQAAPTYERRAPAPMAAPTYERRQSAPMAVPRAPIRSSSPAPQMSQPPRAERAAPAGGIAAPPRSSSSAPAASRAPRPSAPAGGQGRGGTSGGAPRRR